MSDRSKIEWTDATWNPLRAENPATGKAGHHCVKISPACAHCYAASMNKRLGTGLDYSSSSPAEVYLDIKALQQPRRWSRARKIFVCSMTDLFLHNYTDQQIAKVFAVMALHPRHTFQVLTKRPKRMHEWFRWIARQCVSCGCKRDALDANIVYQFIDDEEAGEQVSRDDFPAVWPLPNVQIGVTAENQQYADERIPWLLKCPAAVRFLSCEPLLGPTTFRWAKWDDWKGADGEQRPAVDEYDGLRMLDWVIAGGESGQQARPMHPDWARGLRDQCLAAGVPFFFKQWGEWLPSTNDSALHRSQTIYHPWDHQNRIGTSGAQWMIRVGKKAAGRLLDGREWNEFPQLHERIEA